MWRACRACIRLTVARPCRCRMLVEALRSGAAARLAISDRSGARALACPASSRYRCRLHVRPVAQARKPDELHVRELVGRRRKEMQAGRSEPIRFGPGSATPRPRSSRRASGCARRPRRSQSRRDDLGSCHCPPRSRAQRVRQGRARLGYSKPPKNGFQPVSHRFFDPSACSTSCQSASNFDP